MSDLDALVQLQTLDLDLDEKARRLGQVKAALGESDELKNARRELADAEKRLAALEKRQRELEYDVDDRTTKIRELETKLYGGTIRNPKELSGLQTEIDHMKIALSDAEGVALQAMSDVEEGQAAQARLKKQLADVEGRWSGSQTDLTGERGTLEGALNGLRGQRERAAAKVPAALLADYERLRKLHRQAVARIDRNNCSGCRTQLPTARVQEARLGKVVHCSECGRILYWRT